MSFINPEKVPVTVYKWDDEDAPRLDRSPNCVATIFKACLVTGYGSKQGAGWTMPYEDTNAGVKVLRPAISPEQDFYLRLSADDGQQITTQVYLNMTDVNTGELKLQCDTPFKYAIQDKTGEKWVLVACGRAFWFFHETAKRTIATQSGTYFYCGDTAKNTAGDKAIYLKHTGGTWSIYDTDRYDILSVNMGGGAVYGKLLNTKTQLVRDILPISIFNGQNKYSTHNILAPVLLMIDGEIWTLPAFVPSVQNKHNYDVMNITTRQFINHSTAIQYVHNFYVPTDYWEF